MQSISRRKFATLAGGAGAAALSVSLLPRSAWAFAMGPMGLPVGIQLYMVSKPLKEDTPGTLKKLYDVGYREVETAGTGTYSAAEFRKLIEAAGLTCPSVHLQAKGDDYDTALADAKALGAHYAVTSLLRLPKGATPPKPGPDGGMPAKTATLPAYGLDGFKEMAAKMNEIGQKAKSAGLQYAYHNHNLEFEKLPDGTLGFDVLVKETDPDLVKFEIDCGWMTVAGSNPVEYFNKYPGRFKMLHIKDFKPTSPTTDIMGPGRPKGTDLGTGFVDYKPIFAAGKATGIEHIFAEQEAPFAVSQMASAIADYAYIQKLS